MEKEQSVGIPLLLLAAILLVVAPASVSSETDYLAYAITDKGERLPLPEDLHPIIEKNAKYLVQVEWGEYQGPQDRLAVLSVENESGAVTYQSSAAGGFAYSYSTSIQGTQVPVGAIDALIADILARTGRFRVLERSALDEVLQEQQLAATGQVTQPSGAKSGRLLGARYLLKGAVTHYEPKYKGKKIGLGAAGYLIPGVNQIPGIGGLKVGKNKSMVGMSFRLIDSETGENVFTHNVSVVMAKFDVGAGGLGFGSDFAAGGFFSQYAKTPIGQAVIAACNVGVFELVKEFSRHPVSTSGSVVQVSEAEVVLNLGENDVDPGDELIALAEAEDFIDPETGLSLGADSEELGRLRITSVADKFSRATAVDFDASALSRGDKVISTQEHEPPRFGVPWVKPKDVGP